jgi:hypothetical protein
MDFSLKERIPLKTGVDAGFFILSPHGPLNRLE